MVSELIIDKDNECKSCILFQLYYLNAQQREKRGTQKYKKIEA